MSIGAESTSGDGVHICQKASACCYEPVADRCPVISFELLVYSRLLTAN